MLTHPQIWRAIDALAARSGLSPSGMARAAGLDPTTFNKSKRGGDGGKLRWPSTESLAKVLAATGTSLGDFVALVGETRNVPLIGMAQAGHAGLFDAAGFPAGSEWRDTAFPDVHDPYCYALQISGGSLLPVFRDGDRILVSPSAPAQRGDRVMVKTVAGQIMVMELARMTAQHVELKNCNPPSEEHTFARNEIVFIHRVIWASQ